MPTEDSKIKCRNYTHVFIRLSPQTSEKLKKGEEIYN